MKTFLKSITLIIAIFGMVLTASAQVTTASIGGLVTDQTKQPLPGATVKATHTPSGTTYFAATQNNGRFNISGMRIGGPYVIEVSFIGNKTEKITGVDLVIGEQSNFNIAMKEDAATLEDMVVVAEVNPVISANRTGAQEIITRERMERLPTINRSLNDFTKLTPMSSGGNFAGTSYRFNNVTVDGASFNNSFGLSSSLGASGVEPISIEAIEQIQVMIAPYDVRNGAFTGAGINSVTKAGSNNWQGSAYYFMKSPGLRGYKQKDFEAKRSEFTENHFGLTVGGPIVKNKLFFFINAEIDRAATPINYRPRPNTETPIQGDYSFADENTLGELSSFLQEHFDYNPGSYNVKNNPTEADRLTARIDWNINSKNSLSVKYFYLRSFSTYIPSGSGAMTGGRGPNANAIPFSSAYYRGNNNFDIIMADLNTTINDRMSNTLKVGYSRLRDFRDMDGGYFPEVNIGQGNAGANSTALTTFGTESNSYGNKLDTDIFQIQDNFTWNVGNHQLTFGTQSDYRTFVNGYANSYAGQYKYNKLSDFYADVLANEAWVAAGSDPLTRPTTTASYYKQIYSMKEGGFPYAETKVLSLGFYVQDKWSITPNFNLTYGLRVDTPIFLNDVEQNPIMNNLVFQDGIKVNSSQLPKTRPMLSPRIGFNWDVFGDRTLQIRGGSGLFSGTPPYVWISNQASGNGMLFANVTKKYAFNGQAEVNGPKDVALAKSGFAVTDPDFKYPQLWKTNLAADYKFAKGWVATVEVLYNKDVNSIYHRDINMPGEDHSSVATLRGTDNRAFYTQNKLNPETYEVIYMGNTSKGYSIYTTFQLQKNFTEGIFKGLYLNGSYTFGVSKSVTDGSSSVASSAFKYRPAVNPNAEELGYSAGSFPDRILIQAAYKKEYAKHFASSIGIVYQRYSPFRYSYTYNGDINNDSYNFNDLIFVPANINQINIVPQAGDTRTKDQIWFELNRFISQDPYLKENRGKYADRNGGVAPYVNQVDLNFTQDFFIDLKNGKRNTLRFTADITNFLNMLNKNWGVQQSTPSGWNQQYQFLTMTQTPSAANNYKPGFTMPLKNGSVLENTFEDSYGQGSRWTMQFGVKYMFN